MYYKEASDFVISRYRSVCYSKINYIIHERRIMDLKGTVVFSSGKHGDYDIWSVNVDSKGSGSIDRGRNEK